MAIRLVAMAKILTTSTSNRDVDRPYKIDTSGSAPDIQYSIELYRSSAPSVRHTTGGQESNTEHVISYKVTPRAIDSSSLYIWSSFTIGYL